VKRISILALAAVGAALAIIAPAANAGSVDQTERLRDAVKLNGILQHERKFQRIADAHQDNRAAGTIGYEASVEYVAERLEDAGYRVRTKPFDFPTWRENSTPELELTSPTPMTYTPGGPEDDDSPDVDFITVEFSSSGNVEADVIPTNDIVIPPGVDPNTSTSGCEPEDFPAETEGNISLIQRGECAFTQKFNNAVEAGAAAVIMFNEGQALEGRQNALFRTAEPYYPIPAVFTSFAVGEELYEAAQSAEGATARVRVDAGTVPRRQDNVIATSPEGDPENIVVAGGHLDSVEVGPGINDNGSGVSTLIEIAEEIDELGLKPRNKLRFAFWGAEESGLIGSSQYVDQLTNREREDILLNLNFDMLASPNFVRFVYDGNTDETTPPPGGSPPGSDIIEAEFLKYFDSQGLETEPTAFDGRSDYGPFIAQGIPAGGLFSGAEAPKTAEQAATYGGVVGEQLDPCYHEECDTYDTVTGFPPGLPTLDGNGTVSLNQLSDGAAHATWHFARKKNPLGDTEDATTKRMKPYRLEYRGHRSTR
jgi:Zn-dependent M28 family amino/carboxypeptidase